jgi:hypothetical protein
MGIFYGDNDGLFFIVDYLWEENPTPNVAPSNEDPSSEFMLTLVLNLVCLFDLESLS